MPNKHKSKLIPVVADCHIIKDYDCEQSLPPIAKEDILIKFFSKSFLHCVVGQEPNLKLDKIFRLVARRVEFENIVDGDIIVPLRSVLLRDVTPANTPLGKLLQHPSQQNLKILEDAVSTCKVPIARLMLSGITHQNDSSDSSEKYNEGKSLAKDNNGKKNRRERRKDGDNKGKEVLHIFLSREHLMKETFCKLADIDQEYGKSTIMNEIAMKITCHGLEDMSSSRAEARHWYEAKDGVKEHTHRSHNSHTFEERNMVLGDRHLDTQIKYTPNSSSDKARVEANLKAVAEDIVDHKDSVKDDAENSERQEKSDTYETSNMVLGDRDLNTQIKYRPNSSADNAQTPQNSDTFEERNIALGDRDLNTQTKHTPNSSDDKARVEANLKAIAEDSVSTLRSLAFATHLLRLVDFHDGCVCLKPEVEKRVREREEWEEENRLLDARIEREEQYLKEKEERILKRRQNFFVKMLLKIKEDIDDREMVAKYMTTNMKINEAFEPYKDDDWEDIDIEVLDEPDMKVKERVVWSGKNVRELMKHTSFRKIRKKKKQSKFDINFDWRPLLDANEANIYRAPLADEIPALKCECPQDDDDDTKQLPPFVPTKQYYQLFPEMDPKNQNNKVHCIHFNGKKMYLKNADIKYLRNLALHRHKLKNTEGSKLNEDTKMPKLQDMPEINFLYEDFNDFVDKMKDPDYKAKMVNNLLGNHDKNKQTSDLKDAKSCNMTTLPHNTDHFKYHNIKDTKVYNLQGHNIQEKQCLNLQDNSVPCPPLKKDSVKDSNAKIDDLQYSNIKDTMDSNLLGRNIQGKQCLNLQDSVKDSNVEIDDLKYPNIKDTTGSNLQGRNIQGKQCLHLQDNAEASVPIKKDDVKDSNVKMNDLKYLIKDTMGSNIKDTIGSDLQGHNIQETQIFNMQDKNITSVPLKKDCVKDSNVKINDLKCLNIKDTTGSDLQGHNIKEKQCLDLQDNAVSCSTLKKDSVKDSINDLRYWNIKDTMCCNLQGHNIQETQTSNMQDKDIPVTRKKRVHFVECGVKDTMNVNLQGYNIQNTNRSMLKDTHKPILKNTHRPILKNTQSDMLKGSHSPMFEDTHSAMLRDTHIAMFKDTPSSNLKGTDESITTLPLKKIQRKKNQKHNLQDAKIIPIKKVECKTKNKHKLKATNIKTDEEHCADIVREYGYPELAKYFLGEHKIPDGFVASTGRMRRGVNRIICGRPMKEFFKNFRRLRKKVKKDGMMNDTMRLIKNWEQEAMKKTKREYRKIELADMKRLIKMTGPTRHKEYRALKEIRNLKNPEVITESLFWDMKKNDSDDEPKLGGMLADLYISQNTSDQFNSDSNDIKSVLSFNNPMQEKSMDSYKDEPKYSSWDSSVNEEKNICKEGNETAVNEKVLQDKITDSYKNEPKYITRDSINEEKKLCKEGNETAVNVKSVLSFNNPKNMQEKSMDSYKDEPKYITRDSTNEEKNICKEGNESVLRKLKQTGNINEEKTLCAESKTTAGNENILRKLTKTRNRFVNLKLVPSEGWIKGGMREDSACKVGMIENWICECAGLVNKTTGKPWTTTAYNFHRLMMKELERASEGKQDESEAWNKFLRQQATSCSILYLLSSSHISPLKYQVTGHTHNSKESAFILYNYSRICGIFETFEYLVSEGQMPPLPHPSQLNFSLLRYDEEWALVWAYVIRWPEVVQAAALEILEWPRSGHWKSGSIAHFLSRLAHSTSRYYARHHVLPSDPSLAHLHPLAHARLHLLQALRTIMKIALSLLGIDSPPIYM